MRHLVACSACSRQYDVGERPAGCRFHCACGRLVEVRALEGHEARVVRCSACGGPRDETAATSCRWCGTRFGVGDRDLGTTCPGCFARIADTARFCHSCGMEIRPETLAPESTQRTCPVCPDGRLVGRSFGDPPRSLLECPGCGGLWVGIETFRRLEETSKRRTVAAVTPPKPAAAGGVLTTEQRGPVYRRCVECPQRMNRVNYGRRSGVVVDVCRDHGMWFDESELETVLSWIRSGGPDHARKLEEEARRQEARAEVPVPRVTEWDAEASRRGGWHDLVRALDFLFDLWT